MKYMTIILAGFLLLLGQGSGWAADGTSVTNSMAAGDHLGNVLTEGPVHSALDPLPAPPVAGFDSHEELLELTSIPLWNYAISPQVAIDLACRPFDVKEHGSSLINSNLDIEQITKNILVGIRYTF